MALTLPLPLPPKARTYLRYLGNHLRQGDVASVAHLGKLALSGSTFPGDRLVTTGVGTFYCRGGTNDILFTNPAYEWAVRQYVRQHAAEFDVFLDIGACIGDYSVLLARRGVRCCAFEPVPDNYRALRINVLLNHLESQIQTFNLGCGAREGHASFQLDRHNTGASGRAMDAATGTTEVAIQPLDALRGQLPIEPTSRVLVKIDAEGMELDVLDGALATLREIDDLTLILETTLVDEAALLARLHDIGPLTVSRLDNANLLARKRPQPRSA